MKISIDDCDDIVISEFKEKVIFDLINKDEFTDMIINGINEFINQLYKSSFLNLRNTWIEKLKGENIPIVPEELAQLIFSQPDYLDKREREIQAQAQRTSHFTVQ